MQAYDLLMLIVLALAIVWGAWKGLAWQVASIASIGLSYIVALRFRLPLAGVINASPPWNIFLSMLILFLGTGLVVWVGFNLVSEFIERVKLKEFDRQLGALFGAAKGVLLCVLITLFSVALLGDQQRQAICNSKSGYYIAVLLDRADIVIPHELHDVLAPYLDRLDKTIPHPHTAEQTLTPARGWAAAENGVRQAVEQVRDWPRASQPGFDGQASQVSTPMASFPLGAPVSFPAAAPATPHSAARIEVSPEARPTGGSFQTR
jgi:membrane protein required for colicin V production